MVDSHGRRAFKLKISLNTYFQQQNTMNSHSLHLYGRDVELCFDAGIDGTFPVLLQNVSDLLAQRLAAV